MQEIKDQQEIAELPDVPQAPKQVTLPEAIKLTIADMEEQGLITEATPQDQRIRLASNALLMETNARLANALENNSAMLSSLVGQMVSATSRAAAKKRFNKDKFN